MFNNLEKYLKRPKVYKKSKKLFWQDKHIAKMLLAAHLDPEFEGASRKHEFIDKSVAWISQKLPAKDYATLLDLGCGPGLYTERCARHNYKITGIDISASSLAYAIKSAQEKQLQIEYLQQNYIDMLLPTKFDLALLIYCDYGALSKKERKIVLKNIYEGLNSGGKLLLDVFTTQQFEQFTEYQKWEGYRKGGFWSSENHFTLTAAYKYSGNITLEQTVVITATKKEVYYIWQQYFTEASLVREVTEVGFKVIGLYDDVAGADYSGNNVTLAILLEK